MPNEQYQRLVSRPLFLLGVLITVVSFGVWQSTGEDTRSVAAESPRNLPHRYIVTLRDGVSPELFGSLLNTHKDATVIRTYGSAVRGFAGSFSDRVADALDGHPFVVSIEPDQLVTLADQALPTGITRIGADENANAAIDGVDNKADIDIAVIDTGVDSDHADLNVAGGFTSYLGRVWSWTFCGANTSSWEDGHGHGTHVSGTIAARDNNIGVVGLVPGARIWAVRVLSTSGRGCMSDVIAGIDWVTANADTIEVANISIVGGNSDALCNAIANSIAAGVFYAVAAGNSGRDAGGSSPANCPGVTTVSAIVDTDGLPGGLGPSHTYGADDTFANFTNYGSVVDIAAPGVSINSTFFMGSYAYMSGTSMASPHAAGAAALHILKSGAPIDAAGVQAVSDALIAAGAPQDSALGASGDPDGIPEPILCVGETCMGAASMPNNTPPTDTSTPTPLPPTNTPTNTLLPSTLTDTPAPSTETATPTGTLQDTPRPPTPTNTPTPVPPMDTSTPTNTPTPVPPMDTSTPTNTPIPPTAAPVQGSTTLYVTLGSSGVVDGVSVANEDILAFDGTNFTMYFDGSDVGIEDLALSAFVIVDEDEILMSFTSSTFVLGIGFVDDSDIVKFRATSLGSSTAGSFEFYFDGSDVGLSAGSEDIDALELLPNGTLLISTLGDFSAAGISGRDEDLFLFFPAILGHWTVGGWSQYFDGSDVSLGSEAEDADGVAVDAAGDIYLSMASNFSVSDLSGEDEDIFSFSPTSTGSSTSGSFISPLFFDGSAEGISSQDVKAFDLP